MMKILFLLDSAGFNLCAEPISKNSHNCLFSFLQDFSAAFGLFFFASNLDSYFKQLLVFKFGPKASASAHLEKQHPGQVRIYLGRDIQL